MTSTVTQVALLAFVGVLAGVLGMHDADMRLEPSGGVSELNEVFRVDVIVESNVPVNVFQGDIEFDSEYLAIDSIEYNNSVADLWAERPWYSNGEGTLNFAGGTTQKGGFTGTDTLLTIYFKTQKVGNVKVRFTETNILEHNGLGTEADIADPIDSIFTIADGDTEVESVRSRTGGEVDLHVVPETVSTDLNGDGKQNFADFGLFIGDMTSNNLRSDFDGSGEVDMADMSIILNAD